MMIILFLRKKRRYILITILLLDFCFGIGLTYLFGFEITSNSTGANLLNYLLSYIMGIVTSLCNALLTSLATCLCCEYFPTCCRICAYNIGHSIIMAFFILSICCLGVIIYSIIEVTKEYGDNAFWFTTIYSYILGLFQSWFMIEILSMIWDFHSEWSKAHPQTKEEKETEKKEERKRRGLILTCIIFACKCILFIMFGLVNMYHGNLLS